MKHTHDTTEKSNLRTALDAMKVHLPIKPYKKVKHHEKLLKVLRGNKDPVMPNSLNITAVSFVFNDILSVRKDGIRHCSSLHVHNVRIQR